jgi:hypothetical protein
MSITFISNIKKVFSNSASKDSHANNNGLSSNITEIRDLNTNEFSTVSGGPQITNHPPS